MKIDSESLHDLDLNDEDIGNVNSVYTIGHQTWQDVTEDEFTG